MDRRQFIASLASFSAYAATPWLVGCKPSSPFLVGIHPWIGYEPLQLAQEFHWLPKDIQLVQGLAASDSIAGLLSGKLDAACLTLDEMLRVRGAGIPLAAALIFDVSAGDDVLLARPNIHGLTDLAGKRLGVEYDALGALVLSKVLEKGGLQISAVTVVDLPVDKQLAAWRKNEIDAVITYEPVAALIQRENAHRLFDSREMPDMIFDVLAVRQDRLAGRQKLLHSLAKAYFKGLEHINANRQDAIYRIAARQGISVDEVQQSLYGIILPTLAANREYFDPRDRRLMGAAQLLSTLMVQRGLLKKPDDLNDLTVGSLLPGDED
jgi:NitT/TauT family transport system substrate-binding protein